RPARCQHHPRRDAAPRRGCAAASVGLRCLAAAPDLWPRSRRQDLGRARPGMSNTLNITELREGGSQDLTEVSRIMHEAFDPRFGEAWTSAQCLGMLSLPGVWLVIASLDGSDAGFALA